jgi:hypothetical protein
MLHLLAQIATTLPTTQAVTDAVNKASQPAWVASLVSVIVALTALITTIRLLVRDVNTSAVLRSLVTFVNQTHVRSAANEQNVKALAQVVNEAAAVPARVELTPLPPLPAPIGTDCPPAAATPPAPVIVQETPPPRVQT